MYTTYEFKFTLSKNTINTAAPTTIHSFILMMMMIIYAAYLK